RADALRRQDHVDAAAGAEVEDRLALAKLRDHNRIPAAERSQNSRVGQLAALLRVVQRLPEVRRVGLRAAGSAAAPAALGAFGDGAGRLGVAAANLLAQLVG